MQTELVLINRTWAVTLSRGQRYIRKCCLEFSSADNNADAGSFLSVVRPLFMVTAVTSPIKVNTVTVRRSLAWIRSALRVCASAGRDRTNGRASADGRDNVYRGVAEKRVSSDGRIRRGSFCELSASSIIAKLICILCRSQRRTKGRIVKEICEY